MKRDQLHTTAAMIPTEALGTVYGVRVPGAFWDAWERASGEYRTRGPDTARDPHASLPYSILADGITHTTGALANINRGRSHPDQVYANYFMVLSDPVDLTALVNLVDTWEALRVEHHLGVRLNLAQYLEDATLEPIHLAEHIHYPGDGRPPTPPGWAWNVLTYQIARQLAEYPLIDENVSRYPLHLVAPVSADRQRFPSLLAWDHPLRGAPQSAVKKRYAEYRKQFGATTPRGAPRPQLQFSDADVDRAMVQLTPRVLQVPGYSQHLIVAVQVGTARIAPEFKSGYRIRSGWVRLGDDRPILPIKVSRYGGQDAPYRYRGHELFQQLERFPAFTDEEIARGDNLRLRWRAIYDFGVGRGAGQGTYEVAAQHMREALEPLGAQMLTFQRRGGNIPTGKPNYKPQGAKGTAEREASEAEVTQHRRAAARAAAHAAAGGITRIILLAATPHTLERMRDGMRRTFELPEGTGLDTLTNTSPAFHPHDVPNIEILVRQHPDLETALLHKGDDAAIRDAVLPHLDGLREGAARVGVLIETSGQYARTDWLKDKKQADPKHVLMLALARKNMTTQFLANAEGRRGKPNPHPASKASQDLLRSLGVLPRDPIPTPTFGDDAERRTIFVGLRAVNSPSDPPSGKRKPPRGYYLSVIAQHAGTYQVDGFSPLAGGTWTDLGSATIAFDKHRHDLQKHAVQGYVRRALEQLRNRYPDARIIVYIDAQDPLRGLLRMRDGEYRPTGSRVALPKDVNVVRVRTVDGEVPHSAASGPWLERGHMDLAHTLFSSRIMLGDLDPKPQGHVAYFFDTSNQYKNPPGTGRLHRSHSRFTIAPADMAHPWHSLTTTELIAWQTDGRTDPNELITISATLCRYNPHWEGDTNLPSPLHMAKAMVDDHPVRKAERDYRDRSEVGPDWDELDEAPEGEEDEATLSP